MQIGSEVDIRRRFSRMIPRVLRPSFSPSKSERLREIRYALTRTSADFANMTAIHVAGPYFLAVKFIPLFQKSSDPSVCNITSLAAFFLQRYGTL